MLVSWSTIKTNSNVTSLLFTGTTCEDRSMFCGFYRNYCNLWLFLRNSCKKTCKFCDEKEKTGLFCFRFSSSSHIYKQDMVLGLKENVLLLVEMQQEQTKENVTGVLVMVQLHCKLNVTWPIVQVCMTSLWQFGWLIRLTKIF